ncbi:MAG: glycosyltransferase family 2 protein, partial [Dehalococcoidia bacterium]
GKSKALVTQLVGQQSGLASERTYTLRTLPSGMAWGLAEAAFRMRPVGAARTGAIAAGFALTVAGYLRGRMSQGRERAGGGQESKRDDSPGGGPVRILNVELGSGDAVLGASAGDAGDNATRAITLVSLHGQPLGVVDHPSVRDISSPDDHWRAIQDELAGEIAAHLERDGVALPEPLEVSAISALEPCSLGEPEATEGITVVVATHDRPGMLARCLESLLFQDYPDFRIVVADNAPASDASERLVRQCYSDTGKVEYVRSNVPGLAIAHNSGMGLVGTPLVAFTDDDVTVDHRWLVAINRAFQRDRRIACVTGLIFPAELETPAQLWAEEYWGYKKGFRGRLFNLGPDRVDTPIYPYTAGMFGSGANMAFRTGALREMGGFDPALGAGTKAKGGDDLSAFFETVKRGYTIAYEPAAIVFHPHHREYESMLKQAYGYGAGLTAYLTKLVFDRPWLLLDMARKAPAAAAYLLGPKSAKNLRRPAGLPRELFAVERRGMLHGAWLYAVSRWQTRRLRRRGYA